MIVGRPSHRHGNRKRVSDRVKNGSALENDADGPKAGGRSVLYRPQDEVSHRALQADIVCPEKPDGVCEEPLG